MAAQGTTAVVLVTGAANGIGRAVAVELAKLKFSVAAWDVDQDGLTKLKEDLEKDNPSIKVFVATVDVSNIEKVKEGVATVESQLGPIECLVNNAGVIHKSPCLMKNGKIEDWMRIVNVNVVGTLNVTTAVFPLLCSRKHGHVVNMSSTMGVGSIETQAVYVASKHFIEGLSKTLRKEGQLDGVKVTVVRPSAVETAMTGGMDTTSQEVDKQSVEVWNELLQNKMKNNLPIMMKTEDLGKAVAYAVNLPHDVAINEINISAIGWPEM